MGNLIVDKNQSLGYNIYYNQFQYYRKLQVQKTLLHTYNISDTLRSKTQ